MAREVHRLYEGANAPSSHSTERRQIVKTVTAALLALMMIVVAGCNTVEGAGKDVSAGGKAIEKAADKAKPN
jgi:predicted small secreted protein